MSIKFGVDDFTVKYLPFLGNTFSSKTILSCLYDTLFNYDNKFLKANPIAYCKKINSTKFVLNFTDRKWSNGKYIRPSDFLQTIKYIVKNKYTISKLLDPIIGIKDIRNNNSNFSKLGCKIINNKIYIDLEYPYDIFKTLNTIYFTKAYTLDQFINKGLKSNYDIALKLTYLPINDLRNRFIFYLQFIHKKTLINI